MSRPAFTGLPRLVLLLTLAAGTPLLAADPPPASAEATTRALYAAVSAPAGSVPDWAKVREFFVPESVVVLRTSRTESKVFSLDGFVKDFVDFYETPRPWGDGTLAPREKGFTETVLASRAEEVGDAAQVAVLYEARITGLPRPPTRGVDLWVLSRRDGRWKIVAVVNEVLGGDRTLPPGLFPSAP